MWIHSNQHENIKLVRQDWRFTRCTIRQHGSRLLPMEPMSLSYQGVLEQQTSDKGNMFVFPIP